MISRRTLLTCTQLFIDRQFKLVNIFVPFFFLVRQMNGYYFWYCHLLCVYVLIIYRSLNRAKWILIFIGQLQENRLIKFFSIFHISINHTFTVLNVMLFVIWFVASLKRHSSYNAIILFIGQIHHEGCYNQSRLSSVPARCHPWHWCKRVRGWRRFRLYASRLRWWLWRWRWWWNRKWRPS